MKYRHEFHAGNFADVHKHVTLLALLDALQRKDAGFLYLDTHAGRGEYRLAAARAKSGARANADGPLRESAGEAAAAVLARLSGDDGAEQELARYAQVVARFRARAEDPTAYPGSPALALDVLRAQDRAVLIEIEPVAARALQQMTQRRQPSSTSHPRVECANGFDRLRAFLPPPERRGLMLIDPPFEETSGDFRSVIDAIVEALRRFRTGVIAAWYPIKERRSVDAWLETALRAIAAVAPVESLVSELWLYPPDSRVSLNGSGLLVVNPPYRIEDRMRQWLPHLRNTLRPDGAGGTSVRTSKAGAAALS